MVKIFWQNLFSFLCEGEFRQYNILCNILRQKSKKYRKKEIPVA